MPYAGVLEQIELLICIWVCFSSKAAVWHQNTYLQKNIAHKLYKVLGCIYGALCPFIVIGLKTATGKLFNISSFVEHRIKKCMFSKKNQGRVIHRIVISGLIINLTCGYHFLHKH